MWHTTYDILHVTRDMWHMTCNTWQLGGGEPSSLISTPYVLSFGNEGVWRFGGKGGLSLLINENVTSVFVEQPWLHLVC